MESSKPNMVHATVESRQASLASYINGFVLSVIFTLWAYIATVRHIWSHNTLMFGLLVLAVVQFIVQMFFFLHVGRETKPRWKLLLLFLMIVFVLIVVLGSIWVMYSLNNRMSPEQMNTYMLKQDGGI
jgi:cytochrome o ubiquinol oxidase subunit IV